MEMSKNGSIANFSLVNQSVSLQKINEVGQAGCHNNEELSTYGTLKIGKFESPDVDMTTDNILLGFHSPRMLNSGQTCRNRSSAKREFDFSSVYSSKHQKRDVNIQLNEISELDVSKAHGFDDNPSSARSNQFKNDIETQQQSVSRGYGVQHSRSITNILEFKKKNGLMAQAERQSVMKNSNLLADSIRFISYLECDLCKGNYGMSEFLDHIAGGAQDHHEKVNGTFYQNPCSGNIFNSPDNHHSSLFDMSAIRHKPSINTLVNPLQIRQYDEKIKELEENLKECKQSNEKVNIDKDRIQVELDRIVLELKQTKMEWALSEEKKEESDLSLKNEIKYLINKIMQSKGGNSNISGFDPSASLLRGTKSTGENLSFINNSGFLNYSTNNQNLSMNRSSYLGHNYGNNTLNIISNNLVENKKEQKPCKKSNFCDDTEAKENICVNLRYYNNSGNKLSFDKDETNCGTTYGDSPQRVNEFHTNESSLLHHMSNKTINTKKPIKNLKA